MVHLQPYYQHSSWSTHRQANYLPHLHSQVLCEPGRVSQYGHQLVTKSVWEMRSKFNPQAM